MIYGSSFFCYQEFLSDYIQAKNFTVGSYIFFLQPYWEQRLNSTSRVKKMSTL